MKKELLSREEILAALKNKLEPLADVNAMWEGGAVCFDRFDEWSDIDLQFDVNDDFYDEALKIIMDTLEALGPIDLRYDLPQPTAHGHFQTFIRLKSTSPFLLLDMVVMKHSNEEKFLEKEIHNEPVVHFDKLGMLTANTFSKEDHLKAIEKRLTTMPIVFDLFQVFVKKEIERGNPIEAIGYYLGATLRPLLEILRIHHNPVHYNFHTRYVYYELPESVTAVIEPLFYPAGLDDLAEKHEKAVKLFFETVEKTDMDLVRAKLAEEIG